MVIITSKEINKTTNNDTSSQQSYLSKMSKHASWYIGLVNNIRIRDNVIMQ